MVSGFRFSAVNLNRDLLGSLINMIQATPIVQVVVDTSTIIIITSVVNLNEFVTFNVDLYHPY